MYYTAKRKSDGVSCIGVATTKDVKKGFTDHGIVVEFGKEAIDPFVVEDNGELFITWKAYGLDNRPIELLGCRLSDDGLKLEGTPFMLMRDDEKPSGSEDQCPDAGRRACAGGSVRSPRLSAPPARRGSESGPAVPESGRTAWPA